MSHRDVLGFLNGIPCCDQILATYSFKKKVFFVGLIQQNGWALSKALLINTFATHLFKVLMSHRDADPLVKRYRIMFYHLARPIFNETLNLTKLYTQYISHLD